MSFFQRKKNSGDYLLAGSEVKPWLVALSAVATNCSGYLFIGQIGFTYTFGLQSIWLMVGWILGDFIISSFVHRRLRIQTEKKNVLSFAGVLSEWHGGSFKYLRIIGGFITIAFLGTYAAAQLNAGSKALHVLFGWDYSIGAIIGSVIVLLYCMAGGIRASIWTDAAQSIVMFVAMAVMLFVTVHEVGGMGSVIEGLHNVSDSYMNLFPQNMEMGPFLGPLLFVVGWFFAGVGVIGQPHIMVRFMTIDSSKNIARARFYYYLWYIIFFGMTIGVAFAARLLIPEAGNFDAELALPQLASQLLPEFFIGLVLAGLFAATMSTADSQIISCTASITNDIAPKKFSGYIANKIATICITIAALFIALNGSESVFSLVIIAWSALGSAFAPLLTVYALGGKPGEKTSIAMTLGGLAMAILWRVWELNSITYEILPGIATGFAIYFLATGFTKITGKNRVTS